MVTDAFTRAAGAARTELPGRRERRVGVLLELLASPHDLNKHGERVSYQNILKYTET